MPSAVPITAFFSLCLAGYAGAGELQFNRDIRPILSDKCFHCHGPDSGTREADFRLDTREGALENDGIIPGEPDKSLILERILSHDKDEVMPPTKSKLGRLSDAEIATLKQWIREGAKYELHWAFNSLKQPALLESNDSQPIDVLVRARLKNENIQPQAEADKATLIRRVSFDITGLPPSPEAVKEFLADSRPDAYERLVDHLLASPAYGERMAVDWLDMARYADSYGFQVDREREVWPWRDWVIKAFNENLPFDQFITWQLAGDLLPNATDEQILATAFNRLHQQESEGGSVEEEYRTEYVADRIQTFSTTFLGLTMECARCHDHKFDPLSQKEFFQLGAYFQNIDEAGLYSYFTESVPTPALMLADASSKQRQTELKDKVVALEKGKDALKQSRQSAFQQWKSSQNGQVVVTGEQARFRFDELTKDRLANDVDDAKPATLKGENKLVSGPQGKAIEFTGDDPVDLPLGNFHRDEPFSISLWLKTPDVKERAVVFHRSRAWTDAGSRGYELLIEEGKLKWSLIHFWPGNAISIRAQDHMPLNEWLQVTVTYDGSSRAEGLNIYANGQPMKVDVIKDALTKDITGGGADNIALGERFRDRGFKGGGMDDFRVFNRELSALEVAALNGHLPQDDTLWFEYYLANIDAEWQQHLADLGSARRESSKLADGIKEIMVMKELPQPKKAYVLFRGEYNQPREEVFAKTPEVLSKWPEGAPNNRLGLAQWLTRPEHPLTARVTVNRFWQSIFGRGLVKTSEDFGSQGEKPVHGDVLDTLAWSFIQSGWDVKKLIKSIVMSDTYKQRSVADAHMMADDPENVWLARGPRFRLSAEMIRDNSLALSGLLNTAQGGPPVNPYEMTEAFKPAAISKEGGVYRRSLYTTWRRTAPPPAMIAFDAPRRAVCSAKRERTDSPLQALILLNGTQYVEAARVLGEKLLHEHGDHVDAIIQEAFLRCLSREPDEKELSILRQLYEEQLVHFKAHPKEAAALSKAGNAPPLKALPVAESAAVTVLVQALMNHDACVVKR